MPGILGIEFSTHQIRIVHGTMVRGILSVDDFAVEDNLNINRENVAQQLEGLVARRGFQSSPAAIAITGPGVVHRFQDFPQMPSSELGMVVQREVRTMAPGEEVFLDWEVTNETTAGGLRQSRVLVAMAPRVQVDEARQLLTQSKLKPALVTTSPTSFFQTLRLVQDGVGGQCVYLYLGREEGYLLGTDDGVWSFYREFSSRLSEGDMDSFITEAVREAHRALLYHRQRFPEGREIRFLLAGEYGLEQLKEQLHLETGCEAQVVSPGAAVNLSPLKGRALKFHEQFSSFIIPLGLVAAASVKSRINLIPEDARLPVRSWPRINWSFVHSPVTALLVLLVMGVLVFFILRMENHYEILLGQRRVLYDQWKPAIQAARESQELREAYGKLEEALGASQIDRPSWVSLFKTLGRLAPPDLLLTQLNVDRNEEIWRVELKGEVVSHDAYTAQVAFNGFYRSLKDSMGLDSLELLPLRVTTFSVSTDGVHEDRTAEEPLTSIAETVDEPAEQKRTRIEFQVRGQLQHF